MACTTVEGGYVDTACASLAKAVEYGSTKESRGMSAVDLGELGIKITIRSGDFTSCGGIVASFCPFCGGRLDNLKG